MRIVHITPFYHPVIGGVEEVARSVTEYMASKGNEVHVLTYNKLRSGGIGSLPKEETISNVHVVRLKPDVSWSHGTYNSELPRALRGLTPDLVHVHVWRHPHVFQVAKLKKRLGFKAILHGHAPFHGINQLGLITSFYHVAVDMFGKHTLDFYDKIVALTPHEKRIYTGDFGQSEDKIVLMPNGVDDAIFYHEAGRRASNNTLDLLYVGRVSKEKNLKLAIEALIYVSVLSSVELVIVGPDEGYVGRLSSLAKKMGVTKHLKFIGPVYGPSKYDLYASSRIYVDPCIYEAFGLSLLEAQAFGKPCVITSHGGQVYAAPPGKTSLHAKSNPKDFGEAISLLLNDKQLYEKLSTNAKEWASQHSWSRILPKYDEVYDQLCS